MGKCAFNFWNKCGPADRCDIYEGKCLPKLTIETNNEREHLKEFLPESLRSAVSPEELLLYELCLLALLALWIHPFEVFYCLRCLFQQKIPEWTWRRVFP